MRFLDFDRWKILATCSKIRTEHQDAASLPIIEPNRECEFSLESNGSFDYVARMRAIMFANGQP